MMSLSARDEQQWSDVLAVHPMHGYCVEDELLEASEGDGRLFENLDASSACC